MKIIITGARGLVGQHLARHFHQAHDVLALSHAELDIADREAVRRLVDRERPELIVNCAVIGVDDCERDPARADAVNVEGPHNLAAAATETGAELLHYSTNYVFDGRSETFYTISDEALPLNIYGQTKLAGEQAVQAACPRSYIVRTSWVFGTGRDTFLSTAHRHLLAGQKIKAVTDVWASTTFVSDLVQRTGEIIARRHYATYQVVNAGVCSYHDFAVEASRLVDLDMERVERLIESVREDEMDRLAPRPRYTPLRCLVSEELHLEPLRDWRAALADYITQS